MNSLDPQIDGKRILSQRDRVLDFMLDLKWHTLYEIEKALGYPSASVSARLRDFRKQQYGGYTVDRRRRKEGGGTWEYLVYYPQPLPEPVQEQLL